MRLARYFSFLIAAILLSACADIIPLTGGESDVIAPKPVKTVPETGETNIQPTQVVIEFDEYIVLKEPETTITMSPEVGKLTSELNKRTLTVSWNASLMPQTTYILNINGAIKDLNENNDTIFQVVFSTGEFIDSLSHHGTITSAYSGEFIQNATVCLFPKDSLPYVNKPTYLTRSDRFGNYRFDYLKDGEYTLFAYQDANRDQNTDPTENLAFQTELIQTSDTLPSTLRIFKPKKTINRLKVVIEKPGTAVVSGMDFEANPVLLNGESVELISRFSFDSLLIALPVLSTSRYVFTVGADTLIRQHPIKDRAGNFAVKTKSPKQWKAGDSLVFTSNEYYRTFDESHFSVISATNKTVPYTYEIKNGRLYLLPATTENFHLHFDKAALSGTANSNDTISFDFETFLPEKCGNIVIDVTDFDSGWIFELVNNSNTELGTVVSKQRSNAGKLTFANLIPGQYSFRCFKDENNNGIWDSGDYENKIQPEKMLRYTVVQKVRANWDIEEKLELN
jgi:uncharacterized protein (DUF2141 family)